MPEEKKTPTWHHQVVLVEREEMTVDGVTNLGSFDEQEIVMETEQGLLTVRGEDLNIKQLNLEAGNLVVEGLVKEVSYDDEGRGKKGRGLLGRLLK